MKKSKKVFWGIILILAAILLLIDQTALVNTNIPTAKIILGVFCLYWLVGEAVKKRFYGIFFPIACIFMLFEKNIASLVSESKTDLISNWVVILCAVLLAVGTALITAKPKIRKPKKENKVRFCEASTYIDCNGFSEKRIENNLSKLNIYFENVEAYSGGGILIIENSLGNCNINVPSEWHVNLKIENNIGKVSIPSEWAKGGKELTVKGENNLGAITINAV